MQTEDVPTIEDTPEAVAVPEDRLDDDARSLHHEAADIERSIEALLFVASEPLENKRIAKLTGADERAVALAIQSLQERYTDRGIVLRELAGGYRFATASSAREAVEAYLLPPRTSLSAPALEALAIIAHMQPVTKSEIEAIRGVNSDSVVNTLLDRNLIGEAGRKDVVGRPMQYKTTAFFLESFGLNSLADLPQLELEPGQPLELNLLVPGEPEPQLSEEEAPSEQATTEEAPNEQPSVTEPQA